MWIEREKIAIINDSVPSSTRQILPIKTDAPMNSVHNTDNHPNITGNNCISFFRNSEFGVM